MHQNLFDSNQQLIKETEWGAYFFDVEERLVVIWEKFKVAYERYFLKIEQQSARLNSAVEDLIHSDHVAEDEVEEVLTQTLWRSRELLADLEKVFGPWIEFSITFLSCEKEPLNLVVHFPEVNNRCWLSGVHC